MYSITDILEARKAPHTLSSLVSYEVFVERTEEKITLKYTHLICCHILWDLFNQSEWNHPPDDVIWTPFLSFYDYERVCNVATIQDFTHQVPLLCKAWKACRYWYWDEKFHLWVHVQINDTLSSFEDWVIAWLCDKLIKGLERKKKSELIIGWILMIRVIFFTLIITIKFLMLILRLTLIIIIRSYLLRIFYPSGGILLEN